MMRGEDMARAALQIADPQQRLLAQRHIESELRQLYQTTFPDPAEYRRNGAAYVNRTIDKMHKAARQRPRVDSEISADRLLVAQAVRGSSAKFDVREPAPAFGELSDAALNSFSKQFGFRAI